jgi:hypothetical protein
LEKEQKRIPIERKDQSKQHSYERLISGAVFPSTETSELHTCMYISHYNQFHISNFSSTSPSHAPSAVYRSRPVILKTPLSSHCIDKFSAEHLRDPTVKCTLCGVEAKPAMVMFARGAVEW